jgi:hypothetical protein
MGSSHHQPVPKGIAMNTNDTPKLALGLAALILVAGFSAGQQAPQQQAAIAAAPQIVAASLVNQELPQDQVRDMTYN